MPTVHNGIGTWYYGKQRIHRFKSGCSFCKRVVELESYDTTLYFVVFFVPIIPLGRKRVLEQCPACQRHRVTKLHQWEASKERDIARLLELLEKDPDNRDNIIAALGLAVSYQDEGLFDKLASHLAGHRQDDAGIQAQLGAAYNYFARRQEAEAAYRASLAVKDDPAVREQLALTLLKEGRPQDAEPYLQHILDQKLKEDAGMIFLLVEGYQAQGMHGEALALMDRRDAAFPEFAHSKDYQKQRRISEKYQNTDKRITSAFLSESGKTGYREGGMGARVARLIGPAIVLGLLCSYLGAAFWIGQNRKVFFVNGANRPYTIAINGQEQQLAPGVATAIRVPEGEITLESRDPRAPFDPVQCRIESPFFSRPFARRTFVVNPDRFAFIVWQEVVYAEKPVDEEKSKIYVGEPLYTFEGINYEFEEFPQQIELKGTKTVTKTRIGTVPRLSSVGRLNGMMRFADEPHQIDYAKRWLRFEPADVLFFAVLVSRMNEQEAIAYIKPHLADRPLLVEWHRVYQHLMERAHRERELIPEYQKLVAEIKSPDVLYLLARIQEKPQEADKLLRQAVAANPPSAHALQSLGFRALASGDFDEAANWLEKAVAAGREIPGLHEVYWSALLAAGRHDKLLADAQIQLQSSVDRWAALQAQVRTYVAKGQEAKARETCQNAPASLGAKANEATAKRYQSELEAVLYSAKRDTAGFLKVASELPEYAFETALLQGKLREAASHALEGDTTRFLANRGILYLAARKAGDAKLAEEQFKLLMDELDKEDSSTRQFKGMLGGSRPLDLDLLRRLPVDAHNKRALLAVAAKRYPDKAKDLLPLAQKLDFYRDPTSLCLRNVLN
jgi:Flp pilus assembly protein TadD